MSDSALSRQIAVTTVSAVTEKHRTNSKVTAVTAVTAASYTRERDPYSYYPSLRNTGDISDSSDSVVVTGGKRHGKPKPCRDSGDSEDFLQKTVTTFLARMLPASAIAWATPNDSGGRERVHEGARRKAMGRVAGIPDLFVLHEGKLIGIELKRPAPVLASGRESKAAPNVSDAQAHTMARLNAAGAQCFVCRSIGEVEAALKLCGVPLGRSNPFRPVNVSREMP